MPPESGIQNPESAASAKASCRSHSSHRALVLRLRNLESGIRNRPPPSSVQPCEKNPSPFPLRLVRHGLCGLGHGVRNWELSPESSLGSRSIQPTLRLPVRLGYFRLRNRESRIRNRQRRGRVPPRSTPSATPTPTVIPYLLARHFPARERKVQNSRDLPRGLRPRGLKLPLARSFFRSFHQERVSGRSVRLCHIAACWVHG